MESFMAISPIIERSYDLVGNIAVGANLATADEIADLKGVFGYADREGFLGTIATLLHRIWNAVKSLIGQSDWQRAERAAISIANKGIDKFAPPEVAFMAKASISGGIPAEAADQLLEALNKVNDGVKKMEAVAMPLFNQLLPAIDGARIGADLANGSVPLGLIALFNGDEEMAEEEKFAKVMQYAFDRNYIKPEGQELFAQLPQILAGMAQAHLAERV